MMIGFWKRILNCCGTKSAPIDNITTEDLTTIVQDWRNGALKEDKNLFEVLNEEPKVHVSKVIVKQDSKSLIFLGTFNFEAATIKIIPKAAKHYFEQEVKVLKKINIRTNRHLNLIQFFYESENPKFNYIVTRFYAISLELYTKSTDLRRMHSVKSILRQVTCAIDHIKDLQIVQLNLFPSDIHICPDGYVKLTNFMNSEVIRSKADVAYSKGILMLGCLFYYLLTNGEILHKQDDKSAIENLNLLHSKLKTSDEALCFKIMMNIMILHNTTQLTAKDILANPYFWNENKVLEFICMVECGMRIANDDHLEQTLLTESHAVIGTEGDWQVRIEEEVLVELAEHISVEISNDEGNIIHLIRTITELIHHQRKSPALVKYMGTSPEALLNYWANKFPFLLLHLTNEITVDWFDDNGNLC